MARLLMKQEERTRLLEQEWRHSLLREKELLQLRAQLRNRLQEAQPAPPPSQSLRNLLGVEPLTQLPSLPSGPRSAKE